MNVRRASQEQPSLALPENAHDAITLAAFAPFVISRTNLPLNLDSFMTALCLISAPYFFNNYLLYRPIK
jgi:uncharacterized protein (DUF486 family)